MPVSANASNSALGRGRAMTAFREALHLRQSIVGGLPVWLCVCVVEAEGEGEGGSGGVGRIA